MSSNREAIILYSSCSVSYQIELKLFLPPTPKKQEAEEYETKLKEVQEEQATYRKALELELKKLRTEVGAYRKRDSSDSLGQCVLHTVSSFGLS